MYKCEWNETCNFGEVSFMEHYCIAKKDFHECCESFDKDNLLLINNITRLLTLLLQHIMQG